MANPTHELTHRNSGSDENGSDIEKGGSTSKGPVGTNANADEILAREVSSDEEHVSHILMSQYQWGAYGLAHAGSRLTNRLSPNFLAEPSGRVLLLALFPLCLIVILHVPPLNNGRTLRACTCADLKVLIHLIYPAWLLGGAQQVVEAN